MNTILIIFILCILGLMVYFKTTGARFGKTWTYIIGGLILFFVVSLGYIITRPGMDVSTVNGVLEVLRTYFLWLSGTFDNAVQITGNVANTDWGVNNSTIT